MFERVRSREAVLLTLGALAGCEPRFTQDAPFACSGDQLCPPGLVCDSNICVRENTPPLPTFLIQSQDTIAPELHPDVDRDGVVVCWTRQEEQQSPQAAVYAAFLSSDGRAHGPVVLATFDTQGRDFLASCAPVPRSGGQIVVDAWMQYGGVSEARVVRWRPRPDNLFEGTSAPFYQEASPYRSSVIAGAIRMAVNGDEAWAPIAQSDPTELTSTTPSPPLNLIRLRIDAAALESGVPVREQLVTPGPTTDSQTFAMYESNGGAWGQVGRLFISLFFVPARLTAPIFANGTRPIVSQGFGIPLATYGTYTIDGARTTPPELAAVWNEPGDDRGISTSYRVGWWRQDQARAAIGPRFPFSRLETPLPAAMTVGNYLYVVGSTPVAAQAGGDAGAADASSVAVVTGEVPTEMGLFRVPWGASDTIPFERVRTIPRPLSRAPVTAAAAWMFPGGNSYALTWVEYFRPDRVGRGARYALYLARFPF